MWLNDGEETRYSAIGVYDRTSHLKYIMREVDKFVADPGAIDIDVDITHAYPSNLHAIMNKVLPAVTHIRGAKSCKIQLQRLTEEWLREASAISEEGDKQAALKELEKLTTVLQIVQKSNEMQKLILQAETSDEILGDYKDTINTQNQNSSKLQELQSQVNKISLRQNSGDSANVLGFSAQASTTSTSNGTQ